jgi:cell shape-determining protein MreC
LPRKLENGRPRLFSCQISESAYFFLNRYAIGWHHEPKYSTLDRLISNHKTGEIKDLMDKNEELFIAKQNLEESNQMMQEKLKQLAEENRILKKMKGYQTKISEHT